MRVRGGEQMAMETGPLPRPDLASQTQLACTGVCLLHLVPAALPSRALS